jgi:hypothetical protein
VRIRRALKGEAAGEIEIETPNALDRLGFTFEVGREYLVYAVKRRGVWTTDDCSRTSHIAWATEDLK